MNTCHHLGRFVRDNELVDVNGTSVLRFSLAVPRAWRNSKGEKVEEVSYLDYVVWDKGAETIAKYFKKGDPIIVHSYAKQERWEKDGQKNSKVVFRVESFEFVPNGSKSNSSNEDEVPTSDTESKSTKEKKPQVEDEIPF